MNIQTQVNRIHAIYITVLSSPTRPGQTEPNQTNK